MGQGAGVVDEERLDGGAVAQLFFGQGAGAGRVQRCGCAEAAQLAEGLPARAGVEQGVGVQDEAEVVHPADGHGGQVVVVGDTAGQVGEGVDLALVQGEHLAGGGVGVGQVLGEVGEDLFDEADVGGVGAYLQHGHAVG
ncbi:MAG TPA: hypothetical protein VHO27_07375, partial [Angustibacter sp.]|nr:hypothetical protein [Angustibacter sp.]